MSEVLQERAVATAPKLSVIDCDIHPMLRTPKALHPYLPQRWRDHLDTYGSRTAQPFLGSSPYPKSTPALSRRDSWPPAGGPPGSDLAFMREQHLDPLNIEVGVLQVLFPSAKDQRDPGLGAAMSRALNEWQIAEWTDPEPRLRATVAIACEDADASVAEIRRWGGRKDFASVFMTPRTLEPMGRKRYWPIFAAAAEMGLPIGIHTGGMNGHPISAGGAPSFYFEDHPINAIAMQATLASLVYEGVMEQFPTLHFIMIEGGFGWGPSLAWRMDKSWERMKSEVPHLKLRPSDYIRRQVWFATQPAEEPEEHDQLRKLIDWVGWDRLVFASDYPHW
ncbi:MAG TPA: amidohydrolase family protein, partial [Candidatus Sulfotelmatobacter sp.]|nr:amidohydrolase family protein [Candidatus Sulfotelmatobacter sp.]